MGKAASVREVPCGKTIEMKSQTIGSRTIKPINEATKKLMKRLSYLTCLTFFVFAGCFNRYEKEIIGSYEATDGFIQGSEKKNNVPILILNEDKTFAIKFDNQLKRGAWKADDYGDWTLIEFKIDSRIHQAVYLGDKIKFNNSLTFCCPTQSIHTLKRRRIDQ